jgi:hypothetical protein
MKTKTMGMCLALSFFGTALFAQNKKDTVPQQPPKTDTAQAPKTDTTKASAFVIKSVNVNAINENAVWMNEQRSVAYVSPKKKMKKLD